jgi:hypothetical protein
LSEVTKGNYEGIFTNATIFGVYDVIIYANKSGYVNDTAKLIFTVAIHGDIDRDGIFDEIYIIDESDGDLWSPPVTDGRYIAYTISSGYMTVFDIKANTDTEVWRSDGACEVTFDGSLAAWRIHTLNQWKIHYMDVNSPSISGQFNCFWDASPVADNGLIAFLNKSALLIGDTVTGIVTDTGCKVYGMHSYWLYDNHVVYLTCENYCGFDLDGDGVVDTDSYVPYVVLYDLLTGNNMVISETGSSGYMRIDGATPSMNDHWIAYMIWENWNKTDCNGDGDNLDEVVVI